MDANEMPRTRSRLRSGPVAVAAVVMVCAARVLGGPQPIGNGTITVSYPTAVGAATFSGERDFRGAYFPDATPLGAAPNIKLFSSVDVYGRRANVAVQFPEVLGPDESLIAHAFLKLDNANDYFPGITPNADVTVQVENVHFAEPVTVDRSTFLFHTFWDVNQSDLLQDLYHHPHNLHTLTDPFRDAEMFHMAHEFVDQPAPHQVLGDLEPYIEITGDGTDTLGFIAAIPYDLFRHIHEEGQEVPEGLPAPHGFLEPFHFHFEYVVTAVPEPTSLVLLASSLFLRLRRQSLKFKVQKWISVF